MSEPAWKCQRSRENNGARVKFTVLPAISSENHFGEWTVRESSVCDSKVSERGSEVGSRRRTRWIRRRCVHAR